MIFSLKPHSLELLVLLVLLVQAKRTTPQYATPTGLLHTPSINHYQHTAPTGQHTPTGGIALGIPIPQTLTKPSSSPLKPANFSISRSSFNISQDNFSISRTNFRISRISVGISGNNFRISRASATISFISAHISFAPSFSTPIVTETLHKIFLGKKFCAGFFSSAH